MSGSGLAIVIDGPALVGRSTTIAGLQRRWPEVRSGPLLAVGLDSALAGFGPAARRWRELVLPHRSPAANGGTGSVVWGPLGRELLDGMHRSAAAWTAAGFDIAVDHTFLDRGTVADLHLAFHEAPLFHVGLVCHPDILEERERTAGRTLGQAAAELAMGRDAVRRHLVLDTSESTTDELVDEVFAALTMWQRD